MSKGTVYCLLAYDVTMSSWDLSHLCCVGGCACVGVGGCVLCVWVCVHVGVGVQVCAQVCVCGGVGGCLWVWVWVGVHVFVCASGCFSAGRE